MYRTAAHPNADDRVFASFIRRIDCPVLLVDSADAIDAGTTNTARQALYTTAEKRVLADAGHMMQLDQPATLAEMVLGFLAA